MVNCQGGAWKLGPYTIHDSHAGLGVLSIKDAFAHSSNVAFAKLADQYYHTQPSKFIDHLHKFRLDTITGIDLTASSGKPTIKKPTNRSWANTTIPYMAHGYEELVTPLHMLMLYNAVANSGHAGFVSSAAASSRHSCTTGVSAPSNPGLVPSGWGMMR